MSIESSTDPRARLVREKYFSLRPKPLERWLWGQGVSPAAERVFWLHWQAGLQRGDWCSELPLSRVARECLLDVSTVTRAYQALQRLGCLRRTDPGRDPAKPFQQAIAVTEVRIPHALLVELDQHPSRGGGLAEKAVEVTAMPSPTATGIPVVASIPADPLAGMRGRERLKALSQLTQGMSAIETQAYREAFRTHQPQMHFEPASTLSEEARAKVLAILAAFAVQPTAAPAMPQEPVSAAKAMPRKLSVFELARLIRDLQQATSSAEASELMRQVVWAIEEGALQRFAPAHALHIALKKIREGAWTRPNRMPPNWARPLSAPSVPEICRRA